MFGLLATATAALAVLASTAAATRTGASIIVNQSWDPVYLWVVPDANGSAVGDRITVHAGGAWQETLHAGLWIGNATTPTGVAIKISKDPNGIWDSAPLQILAYTLTGGRIWYNLDAINGAPFKGQNVRVTSEGAGSIEWPIGEDIGDITRDNDAEKDLVLVISPTNRG